MINVEGSSYYVAYHRTASATMMKSLDLAHGFAVASVPSVWLSYFGNVVSVINAEAHTMLHIVG